MDDDDDDEEPQERAFSDARRQAETLAQSLAEHEQAQRAIEKKMAREQQQERD